MNKYFERQKSKIKRRINGNISIRYTEINSNDKFTIRFLAGNVDIHCHHFLGEAYALNQCLEDLSSGYIGELPETRHPRFSIRPLWCVGSSSVKITESLTCDVPSQLLTFDTLEKQEMLCQRLIEMGYNALIIGGLKSKKSSRLESSALSSIAIDLAKTLASWNLKLILKPKIQHPFCPFSEEDRNVLTLSIQDLQENYPSLFAILWESQLLNYSYSKEKRAREALLYEFVLEELKILENSLNPRSKLIFHLPSEKIVDAQKQAEWFLQLADSVGENTILSYPSLAGEPTRDHRPLHPIWNTLMLSQTKIYTPLMPIANFGSVCLGEGLWPSLPLRLFNQVFQRCERHCFIGIASLSTTIPSPGGLLDCSLWSAGRLMWDNRAPELVIEQWFKIYRPDLDFAKYQGSLLEMDIFRSVISDLQERLLYPQKNDTINDELRLLADSLFSRILHLFHFLEVEERKNIQKNQKPTLYDYFIYFARDLRRIILHVMQSASLSTSGLHHEMDLKESFWTTFNQGGVGATRGSGTIALHENAQSGTPGSKMRQIYEEKYMECGEVNV